MTPHTMVTITLILAAVVVAVILVIWFAQLVRFLLRLFRGQPKDDKSTHS